MKALAIQGPGLNQQNCNILIMNKNYLNPGLDRLRAVSCKLPFQPIYTSSREA